MACISVPGEFGIILRHAALAERNVTLDALLKVFMVEAPRGANDDLISFGPNFGAEALETLTQSLINLGLRYGDDFFELVAPTPEWCELKACGRPVASTPQS